MMPNIKGGLNLLKKAFSPEEVAGVRSRGLGVPGVDFADPLAPATMRMSEALGNAGAEGKTLNFTEADRSRVFGPNRGGVGFSGLQHSSEPHKKANTVWGFGNKATAEKKIRQNDPENSLFTTFVGSPQQHKSNSVVIGDAIKEFQKSVEKGVVPREQIMLMNKRLNEITDEKTGAKVFEDGFDLTDPSALSVANTFSRRAAVGDVMLGLGVKGPMARLDFKKQYPNTKFTDGSNIENILKRETDPDLIDAGTFDVGNRLFVMDGKIIERPDLNAAFPFQVTGDDLGMKFKLTPKEIAMRDFVKQYEQPRGKTQQVRPPDYMDLSRNKPSQFVDEDYLNSLQKAGYKEGGSVDIKAADARLAAAMQQRMAKGGEVDIEAADARLSAAMAQRMAGGGLLKSAAKGVKRLFSEAPQEEALKLAQQRAALPPAKGGLGLPAGNTPEQRAKAMGINTDAYHGSKQDIVGGFKPGYDDNLAFVTKSPEFASKWIGKGKLQKRSGDQAAQEVKSAEDMYREVKMRNMRYDDELNDLKGDAFNNEYDRRSALSRAEQEKEFGTSGRPDDIHSTVYPLKVEANKTFNPETDLEVMGEFFEKNGIPQQVQDLYASGNYMMYETKPVVEYLKSKGYDSMRLRESTGDDYPTIAVFKPETTRSRFAAFDPFRKDVATAATMGVAAPDLLAKEEKKANGGMVTIHPRVHEILNAPPLRMKGGGTVQRFDGGGIASPEENNTNSPESFFESKRYSDIKKNASEMLDKGKQSLSSDYDRLKNSARARAQLAKIAAAQLAGTAPDIASLVTPLVNSDAVLSAFPMARAAKIGLTGTPSTGRRESVLSDEQTPYSLSDLTNNAEGNPIGGSEDIIKRAQKADLMHTGRFSPLTEIGTSVLGGLGASKAVKGAVNVAEKFGKGFDKGYARAMSKQEPPFLNELGYDSVLDKQPVKLLGQQPQAMTALPGTPQGATYATKQEGPFYRVSPTTLDVSKAKSRGIREADGLQSPATVGGTAGQAGREVPQLLSPEEVGRIIADPAANEPLQIAKRFTKETQGADFAAPNIPESSLAKQSAIGRAHQLAVEGSPEYKTSVFDAYAKQMPEVLEQSGAKSYDDLMEKAYRQLAKETDEQFQQLPYNFSYHRSGEGNYNGAMDMASDVHGNKHLYVFQGGDKHDFLNRMDKASGLNENEKFRAVHDLLGHAIYGNQFGPKGEEIAWAVHQQMYSPLARLAMTAETRGQNSLVNYSPLNANLKAEIAKYDNIAYEANRRGDTALVNEINALKRRAYSGFQFAPQKAVLLPPEFISPKFSGGLPDYLSAANKPAKGTESQSALTHFSSSPGLELLDPKRYGTGIKGAEAKRLNEYEGGVKDRSYVYLGEPGTVSPEPGLGVNRYRAESENLYDITKDPLNFRTLARESNRTPFTAKANAGVTYPLQEANDYERLVKEYGYEGMINPNASKPMGIMFKPTPVQPRKRGGLTQTKAR